MILYRTVAPLSLFPPFKARLDAVLGPLPETWVTTQGWRSWAYQNDLWQKYQAGGPRAAPPGHSAHEVTLAGFPAACAVDVCLDGDDTLPGLQPDYDIRHPGWQRLFAAIQADPYLHSGISFHDPDHIEWIGWQHLTFSGALKP